MERELRTVERCLEVSVYPYDGDVPHRRPAPAVIRLTVLCQHLSLLYPGGGCGEGPRAHKRSIILFYGWCALGSVSLSLRSYIFHVLITVKVWVKDGAVRCTWTLTQTATLREKYLYLYDMKTGPLQILFHFFWLLPISQDFFWCVLG